MQVQKDSCPTHTLGDAAAAHQLGIIVTVLMPTVIPPCVCLPLIGAAELYAGGRSH